MARNHTCIFVPQRTYVYAAKIGIQIYLYYKRENKRKPVQINERVFGSPCWTRTNDISVNSRTLYQLS